MPKKSKTPPHPHTRLVLSGDIGSPADVLAAEALTEQQKRETLENWLHDLQHSPRTDDTRQVLKSVKEALARLG